MPTLLDTVTGIALDPSVLSALQSDLTGVAGRVTGLPTSDIQQIVTLVGQIALPDEGALFGDGAVNLRALVRGGLRSPDSLWSSLSDPLRGLEESLSAGLRVPMNGAFDALRNLNNSIPDNPAALLGNLTGPLQQAADILGESPALRSVTELIPRINELRSQIESAPAQLAGLVKDQIEATITSTVAPMTPVTDQLDQFLNVLGTELAVSTVDEHWQAASQRLTPAMVDAAAVDFSSAEAVANLEGEMRVVRALLENLEPEIETGAREATTLISASNAGAWAQRLASGATLAGSAQVNDIAGVLQSWRTGLESARGLVADLSLDRVLQPLRDLVAQLDRLFAAFDLSGLKTELQNSIHAVTELANSVRQAQIDVLAGLQGLANSITQVIDSIDLSIVENTITNALSTLDPVLGQIEQLIDTVTTQLQDALDRLRQALSSLLFGLTDPEGKFRKPFEDFLKSIRDAIPANIPETLEQAGQAIGDAVSQLDDITLEPVFDTVVEQLEEMRAKLRRIDVATLNALLQAALAAVMAVFNELKQKFNQEVGDFLRHEYDQAIEDLAEPAIDALQQQVDGILDFLRANGPATLFETIGVAQTYQNMVNSLDSFRPSAALQDVMREVHQVADVLDGFTPSVILQPIVEPLNQLQRFVQSLSLEPVFAQLESLLDPLIALLDELDIAPFINQLNEAVAGVREKIDDVLTINGLLDFLRPIHTAVMQTLNTVDPATLLQPLTELRPILINAIESIDATAFATDVGDIRDLVNGFSLAGLRTRFETRARALLSQMTTFDLPAKLMQFRTTQQAIRAAIVARGLQSDPAAEERRQGLLLAAEGLDPLPILANALTAWRTLQTNLATLSAALVAAFAESGALRPPLQTLGAKLRELSFGALEAGADIKQILRNLVTQTYQSLGIEDLLALYNQIKATFQSFSPESLEAAFTGLLSPIRGFLDSLLDPGVVLAEVVTAFNSLKAIINPGLRDFLHGVRADLQPILDSVKAKIDALNPAALLAPLDATYTNIIALKNRLLAKLQGLLNAIDEPYEQIVRLIDALNPGTVLVAPLQATYEAILAKIDDIDIRAVFQPLLDALKSFDDQLEVGINRTFRALESFVSTGLAVSGAPA
jgi:hypothetical protein